MQIQSIALLEVGQFLVRVCGSNRNVHNRVINTVPYFISASYRAVCCPHFWDVTLWGRVRRFLKLCYKSHV
jgi:hypothetical protein